jgi:hypothetical protein
MALIVPDESIAHSIHRTLDHSPDSSRATVATFQMQPDDNGRRATAGYSDRHRRKRTKM